MYNAVEKAVGPLREAGYLGHLHTLQELKSLQFSTGVTLRIIRAETDMTGSLPSHDVTGAIREQTVLQRATILSPNGLLEGPPPFLSCRRASGCDLR